MTNTNERIATICREFSTQATPSGFVAHWVFPGYLSLVPAEGSMDGMEIVVTPDQADPQEIRAEISFGGDLLTLMTLAVRLEDISSDENNLREVWEEAVEYHRPALELAVRLAREGVNPCTHPDMQKFAVYRRPIEDLIKELLRGDRKDPTGGDWSEGMVGVSLERVVLRRLKSEFGYDFQTNVDELMGLTHQELWAHYRDVILPRLRASKAVASATV